MNAAPEQAPDQDDLVEDFRNHVRFLLQREKEDRIQMDAVIREQLIEQLRTESDAFTKKINDLNSLLDDIEKRWEKIRITAGTQKTEVEGRFAELADNVRKASEPIREYQLHAQKLQTALQSLTQSVEQNTREVAGVTGRALLGGALGGAGAAFLIFLFLHFLQR